MDNREESVGLVLPNSTEAEISVLGAMLQDSSAVLRAAEQLSPDDFYHPEHKEIFQVMADMNRQHMPIDLVTLQAELSRRGTLEGIGGNRYLLKILSDVPTAANVRAYIEIVQEKSTLRKMIAACRTITKDCYSQDKEVQDILTNAEKSIFDIVMNRQGGEELKPLSEVLVNTYSIIEELARQKGQIAGVPTGFIDLDSMLTGLHPGELIIIGARPAMGKTSFAMNIAEHAALCNKTTAVFTLEMPREQIAMRLLCSDARVDMQRVRKGTLEDSDWLRLAQSLAPLSAAPMYIDDTSALSPTQLRSRCRRLMMDRGLDLVVVDYLGLMKSDGKAESRQLEVSEISRRLKAIALELKIPIIACAQLSRANKDRVDKRPMLSDLRDSGSIEQDADVVMFLHREEYYNKETEDKNIGEVIISKQRSGPLGTVKLAWLSEFTTFANLAKDQGGSDAPF
ncbi:replicative DNA helicase [Aristaeella lactis]|uniref:Replicative DNA helicase n=1 Tax=Aristaeella lactis TaxID=3046383 RepID=A0AC61PP75_9FIRM|nr:replicative DNA helicase [Aristaeella lactis]QUA53365.1 replicative DNA helicase [Aristaeella lactis]SMC79521.1 replicative DNA helicase [Aristaeella lactis]